jgi:lipoprotein-anchoring transpeptidase ErfK/SrfK
MRTALLLGFMVIAASPAAAERAPALTADSVNSAQWQAASEAKPDKGAKAGDKARADKSGAGKTQAGRAPKAKPDPLVMKTQVLLERAKFSPGAIDAKDGTNLQKALWAFQQAKGMPATGRLDAETWAKLAPTDDVVMRYTISEADTKGPFVKKIPKDFVEMAEIDALFYGSARELLAEKFHMSEALLALLNPGKRFDRPGTEIVVANVTPLDRAQLAFVQAQKAAKPAQDGKRKADAPPDGTRVEVNKAERALRVYGPDGSLAAYFPISIGSDEKPAPSGRVEVKFVAMNPTYRYNPAYAFKGQTAEKPVKVKPGPNNPVGLMWIGLSADSYGLHGTPNPDNISKTESNGCVRLTNWDAIALAKLVRKGTPVDFVDGTAPEIPLADMSGKARTRR